MKRNFILIAAAMIAAFSMVSCKNNKNGQEPVSEEIQEQKEALADSVLTIIDDLADKYIVAKNNGDFSLNLVLTDKEKMVKPDYLLDLDLAPTLITKNQKVYSMGIYLVDLFVRNLYDMPVDKNKEVIASLAADVNYPFDLDFLSNFPAQLTDEMIRKEYATCKERNELGLFWRFQKAIMWETDYLFTMNPELYYSKLTEEQMQAFNDAWDYFYNAALALSEYDDEMKQVVESSSKYMKSHIAINDSAVQNYKNDTYGASGMRGTLVK